MFSGLKSILFGYSDSVDTANPSTSEDAQNAEDSAATIGTSSSSSLSNDTSALLEQTLNAATTKFTEQLLPTSPSIEQLQSSSHQLLPSLNEQHEELEKRKKNEEQVEELKENVNYEDDDECFIADSWELLDLVESKPEKTVSAISAVQSENLKSSTIDNSTTKTNGILKQTKTRNNDQPSSSGAGGAEQQKKQNQRQKPKVSFETPDLVIEKQKIEPIAPKDESFIKPKKSKSKNKRNKQVNKLAATTAAKFSEEKVDDQKRGGVRLSMESKFEIISNVEQPPKIEQQSRKTPVLNYAAALSMKLKKNENDLKGKKPIGESSTDLEETLSTGKTSDAEEKKLQASGAVKRNRPVSTSSWSSSDEIEAIDLMWNKVVSLGKANVVEEKVEDSSALATVAAHDNEDNESVISSGFSDCDYGYHGLNDFIMRPKKTQNKRRGVSATSSGLLSSMTKRGLERLPPSEPATSKKLMETSCRQQQEQKAINTETKGKWSSTTASTYSLKQTRPKKKKKILSSLIPVASTSSADYLKSPNASSPIMKDNFVVPKSRAQTNSVDAFLKPSSPLSTLTLTSNNNNLVASSFSGNDSSDVAEMDESWYVTPPPCFTGSNKLDKPKPAKAREAARENALIEHPSFYIAETSKQKLEDKATCACPFKLVEAPSAKPQFNDGNKRSTKRSQKAMVVLKNETKWKKKNKFVVTKWPGDEQDNMNDDFFDNIFETLEPATAKKSSKKKSTSKKSAHSKKVNSKQALTSKNDERIDLPLFDDLFTGYESDFSIPSPALVGLTDNSTNTDLSIETVSDISVEVNSEGLEEVEVKDEEKDQDENKEPLVEKEGEVFGDAVVESRRRRAKSEKKAPVVVEPILPERQPGWQLKKKRNKRRPLVVGGGSNGKTSPKNAAEQQTSADNSVSSSARSSPNLIDRIGQSIVANLTNLTSGFSGSAQQAISIQPRAVIEEVERLNQSLAKKTTVESNLGYRRRMSKSYLDRQNDCAKVANSTRRADRRLKMHSTPNGVSVNRKVHTNIH